MSRWTVFAMLLLQCCMVLKEKNRLKRDSLSRIKIEEQWQWKQQWQKSELLFRDSNSLQAILIKADAPFRWQADSGLVGNAGNYQLYLSHSGKVLKGQAQQGKQELEAGHQLQQREVYKSVKEDKRVSLHFSKVWGLGVLVLLVLVVFWRRIWRVLWAW